MNEVKISDYHDFIDEVSHSALARGMIRMAEDAADDGQVELAIRIFKTVVCDLAEHGELMQASMLCRGGNKMIGIAPDDKSADAFLKKQLGVQ